MALKDYFRKFEEVLEGFDEKDPWPTKEDLEPGKIYIDQKSYLEIQSFLRDYRYCLVEGAERRGKTTLVRCIGFSYIEDWYVAQLDVSRVSDTNDIAPFITQLEKSQDLPKTLIIVEDCHISPEVTKVLLRAAEKCREASFLFTMRTVKQGKGIRVEDPFEGSVIREQDWVVQIDEDNETIYNNVKGIVEKYKEIHSGELEYKSPQAIPSSDDYRYLVEQTGGNKRILIYCLDAWISSKSPTLSLQWVGRALIIEQFHKERLQGLSDVQIEVLLTMSALGQFEVPIFIRPLFPSAVSKLDFDRAADELSGLKGLAFRLPQGAWLLADTESRLTLECMEYRKMIDGSFGYGVLRMYVKEAANYFEVFHALHRAQERALLISLVEDAEVHNSLVRRFGEPNIILSEMLYVLRAIGWADKTKALELWYEYKKTAGKRFFDEVQRKLVEAHDIRLTGMLLQFLRIIDKEGEAIPLADALPAELFISQVRPEVVGFSYVLRAVQQLHTLAPERAKQVLNGLNESDYEKLGEKARHKNSQQIMWFLRYMTVYTEPGTAAEAFVEGIGLEVISEMIRTSAFSVAATTMKFLSATVPVKAKQIMSDLDESDYAKLGEKARDTSLQTVCWFLHFLNADTEREKYTKPILEGIGSDAISEMIVAAPFSVAATSLDLLNGIAPEITKQALGNLDKPDYEKLAKAARSSSLQKINWFLRRLGQGEELKRFATVLLDAVGEKQILELVRSSNFGILTNFERYANRVCPGWVDRLEERADFPWDELVKNSAVSHMASAFYSWAQSHDVSLRKQRKRIVRYLSAGVGGLHLGKDQKAQPVKHLGRLLFYSYYLDEDAAKDLAGKAIAAFDPGSMEYTLEHLARLIKNSRWCNRDASQQLVEKAFGSDAAYLLSKGDLDWFCQIIWEGVLSNELRTREWVAEAGETFWANLVANAPASNAFRLLLTLWQVDVELGRRITAVVGQRLLIRPELTDEPQATPLLGFLVFCDLQSNVDVSFSPRENIDELCVHPAIQRLACSLFYLQKSKPEVVLDFIRAMLTHKGIAPSIALLLAEHQLPWTTSSLEDILVSTKSETREEREDIYDRMLLLFVSIRSKRIYLGTMLNQMCSPQFVRREESAEKKVGGIEHEEERLRSRATIWLNNAIDKGTFTVQKTEHPITHRASRLLNLNRDNPHVTLALDITRDLFLALHDAQRGKEWADGDAWDTALFRGRWKGEPLSPQQLQYWKGILLKMNAITADYQQTDEGEWMVAFYVNGDHPLVKSLIG